MQEYQKFIRNLAGKRTMVAHRGAWYGAPENSLTAIEQAFIDGHPIVEIDLQRSVDGHLFVFHDLTLERMTKEIGRADERTLTDLTCLLLRDRDGGSSQSFSNQTIPTLEAALEAGRGKVYFDLDIKYEDLFDPTAKIVSDLGVKHQVSMKGRAPSGAEMERLNELHQSTGIMMMPLMEFTDDHVEKSIELANKYKPAMIEVEFFDNVQTVAEARKRVPRETILWVNTLNGVANQGFSDENALRDPAQVWGTLFDIGVDVIQTDAMSAFMDYTRATALSG